MDETSPLVSSLRAIRRSLSSSLFNPIQRNNEVQAAPQTDPVTTNLINQNSLTLNLVSQRLENISQQMSSLNNSLTGIRESLVVNQTLEKRREDARKNRERILAEQGLREGKEDALEKNIQNSLTVPVQRVSGKTQKSLISLNSFFGFLTAGWLTKTGLDLLRARADGNTEKFEQLKTSLTRGLVAIGATLTALSLGLGRNLLFVLGRLGITLSRAALGGVLAFKIGLLRVALVNLFKNRFPRATDAFKFFSGAIISGLLLFNESIRKTLEKISGKTFLSGFNLISNFIKNNLGKMGINVPKFLTSGATLKSLFIRSAKFIGGTAIPIMASLIGEMQINGKSFREAFESTALYATSLVAIRKGLKNLPKPNTMGGKILLSLATILIASGGQLLLEDAVDFFFGRNKKPKNKAMGGPVQKGEPYIVGEIGPELFVPNDNGTIIANDMINAVKIDQSNLRAAIASLDENNLPPNIISFPIQGGGTGGGGMLNSPPSNKMESNILPDILFNQNNIHLVHATAMYGVSV